MAQYKLWGVYVTQLEQWTRENGARIEAAVDNEEHDLEVEYFGTDDPRVKLYGWKNFPVFVAVKYDQPFRIITGKHDWKEYDIWLKGLGWKIDQ